MTYRFLFYFLLVIFNVNMLLACRNTEYHATLYQENAVSFKTPRLERGRIYIAEKHIPVVILKKIFSDQCFSKNELLEWRLISKNFNSIIVDVLAPRIPSETLINLEDLKSFPKIILQPSFPLIAKITLCSQYWNKKDLSLLREYLTPENFPYLKSIFISKISTGRNAEGEKIYNIRKILDKFPKKKRTHDFYSKTTVSYLTHDMFMFTSHESVISQSDMESKDSRFYRIEQRKEQFKKACYNIYFLFKKNLSFNSNFDLKDSLILKDFLEE